MSRNKTEGVLKASGLTKKEKNGINNFRFKGLLTLVDDINLKIIEELVKNPNTSSASLATKLRMPLSSLQRRRAKLEKSVLVKAYLGTSEDPLKSTLIVLSFSKSSTIKFFSIIFAIFFIFYFL